MKGRERKKERKVREGETEGKRRKKVLASSAVCSEGKYVFSTVKLLRTGRRQL